MLPDVAGTGQIHVGRNWLPTAASQYKSKSNFRFKTCSVRRCSDYYGLLILEVFRILNFEASLAEVLVEQLFTVL